MKIDTDHLLFYNYSPDDSIQVRHGQLYVNDKQPCVISCPGNASINPYLTELGYTPPAIHYDWTYRFRTYLKHFLPEILLVTIIIATLFYVSFPLSLVISFVAFTTFVEYELHVKHYPISTLSVIAYLFIDALHIVTVLVVIYLLFNWKCSLKKLMILNTLYLIIVFLFYFYKRCVVSVYQNKLIGKTISWTGPFDRINYFWNPEKQYVNTSRLTSDNWMNANKNTCFLIIALNVYCLYKMHKN